MTETNLKAWLDARLPVAGDVTCRTFQIPEKAPWCEVVAKYENGEPITRRTPLRCRPGDLRVGIAAHDITTGMPLVVAVVQVDGRESDADVTAQAGSALAALLDRALFNIAEKPLQPVAP